MLPDTASAPMASLYSKTSPFIERVRDKARQRIEQGIDTSEVVKSLASENAVLFPEIKTRLKDTSALKMPNVAVPEVSIPEVTLPKLPTSDQVRETATQQLPRAKRRVGAKGEARDDEADGDQHATAGG